jgi:hypothetical protein
MAEIQYPAVQEGMAFSMPGGLDAYFSAYQTAATYGKWVKWYSVH